MSGYVARKIGGFREDKDEIQFLMQRKNIKKEMIFPSREECIKYFREKEHYATDDLLYIIWFEEGEDLQRNLLTNELLQPKIEEEEYVEEIVPEETEA